MVERKERITAEVDAKIGKFKRKMREVSDELNQVSQAMSASGVVAGQLQSELSDVAESSGLASQGLSAAGAEVADVRREASAAVAPIDTLGVSIRALPGRRVVDLDVESSEAQAEVAAFRSSLRAIDEDVDVAIDREVATADGLASLPDSVTSEIDATVTPSLDRSALDSVVGEALDIDGIEVPATVDLDETGEGRLSALRTRLTTLDETVARPSVDMNIDGSRLADVRTRIDSALSDVRDMTATASITADTSDASERLYSLRERLESIEHESVTADIEASIADADSLRALSDSLDETGDQALGSSAELNTLEESVDGLDDAISESASLTVLTERIDELGDESSEAARETGGLAGALGSVASAAVPASVALSAMPDGDGFGSGLSANVAGLSGSLGTLLPLLALAGTLIPGLISGLGGLATAAVGLSGALAGIFAGGLLAKGQELADQSAEIEDKFAGAQQILKNFKDELSQALEPLQNIPGAGAFSFDVLDAAVGTVRKLSEAGADLAGVLIPMADRLMAVGDAAGSAALDELVTTVREFAPYLEAAIGAGLRLLPDLLAAIREDASNLAPAFASFASAVIIAAPVIADMGVAIGQVLLPVLAGMARALAPLAPLASMLADAIASVPVWVFEAVGAALLGIAGAIGVLALPALASALGSAAVAAGAFVLATLPISGTVLAIALAIGAVIGVLGYLVTYMDAVGKAWKKVVDFMADKIQGLLGFFTDQINKLLAVTESMRQKLNAVLPDSMEIEGRIGQIETPQVGDDVQSLGGSIGSAVDDMMPDSGSGGSGEATEGQQAGGPVVHGDYFEGPVDQSNKAEVETSEDKRIARAVEDALDRSRRHSNRRGSASQ